MNNYTADALEKEVLEYFDGFFSAIEFQRNGCMVRMRSYRKQTDNFFEHLFDLEQINSLAYSFHHMLENIKGNFARAERIILLQNNKQ